MKKEIVRNEFCIQCGDQFVSEWSEPQFTSYYLGTFDNLHMFDTEARALDVVGKFDGAVIKKIKKTIIIELDDQVC